MEFNGIKTENIPHPQIKFKKSKKLATQFSFIDLENVVFVIFPTLVQKDYSVLSNLFWYFQKKPVISMLSFVPDILVPDIFIAPLKICRS